jgi:hypothetical protein
MDLSNSLDSPLTLFEAGGVPWEVQINECGEAIKNLLNMRVVSSGKGHPMPFWIDWGMSVEQNWKRKR